MKNLRIFLVLVLSVFSFNSLAYAEAKTTEQLQAQYGGQMPYIIHGTAFWYWQHFYNAHTDQRLKYKEWSMLLNSVPGNENFRKKDIAYQVMSYTGYALLLSSLIPLVAVKNDAVIPDKNIYASLGLAGGGLVLTSIFVTLQNYNRQASLERYNMYVVGVKKKF